MFGAREAAWPLIRADLDLSYVHIGLLLTVPAMASHLVEPALGILGDVWDRRRLILGGGVVFVAGVAAMAVSPSFAAMLAALALLHPASGAFVGLAQASFMDADATRHEQNMARWTFAGSVGVVLGALALALSASLGGGWRFLFVALAFAATLVVVVAWRTPLGATPARSSHAGSRSFLSGVGVALRALRSASVLRWLAFLELSDLMGDVLFGYLALYFVDVARASGAEAALGVAVWTGFGLLGDLLLIPILERVRGLTYLRFSAAAEIAFFVAFLIAPTLPTKLVAVALLGIGHAGWYSVLQAQVYTAMPGRSGTVLAVQNVSGLAGSLIPLGLGFAAAKWGLATTMWLLLAGPVALVAGIPRATRSTWKR